MPDVYATIAEADQSMQELLAGVLEIRAAEAQQRSMLDSYLAEVKLPDGAEVLEVGCGDDIRERDEPPLDDDALLVRGGQFRIAPVLSRAEACDRRLGFPRVSVAHAATGLLLDLCELSPRLLDYDECATTTAGRVREHFASAATGVSPHFSIVLPAADLASVRLLRGLFETGVALPSVSSDR